MARTGAANVERVARRPAAEPEPRPPMAQVAVDLSPRGLALASLARTVQAKSASAGSLSRISPSRGVAQRVVIAGTTVLREGGYPCFNRGGKKYHINQNDTWHVTCDTDGRTHYYFSGSGQGIKDAVGPGKKKGKFKFSQLPPDIQIFIKNNFDAIVGVKEEGVIPL